MNCIRKDTKNMNEEQDRVLVRNLVQKLIPGLESYSSNDSDGSDEDDNERSKSLLKTTKLSKKQLLSSKAFRSQVLKELKKHSLFKNFI
ncbi:hypothetical protein ACOME3_008360 [Neoechinorhynchus agilis]